MDGWVKIHRKIVDNPYYFSEPFTRSQAWVDMIIIANHKPGMFYKRGIRVDVKRGEIGYDIETLSKRWKWSRGKAERFFLQLENDSQIVRQKTNVTTIISILNYEMYQASDKAEEQPDDKADSKADGQQTVKQTDTNKKDKNKKNDKNDNNSISAEIEKTWETNYETYLKECEEQYSFYLNDQGFISKQMGLNPGVDVITSIKKGYENFWHTERGWKHKKKSKTKEIDWQGTIINSIDLNRVYIQRTGSKPESTTGLSLAGGPKKHPGRE